MTQLLARAAESAFWMARYVERAENLARIIDVNETFARDDRGGRSWLPIVQLNADEERFFRGYSEATDQNVLHFYIADAGNPTSIRSAIRMARENARTLRPLISTEVWSQLNMLHNRMLSIEPAELALPNLVRVCNEIKEGCQTHTGIVEGTFFRDEGWYFYGIGRWLERADQITRLLDIKYHGLLASSEAPGSPMDISQWNALLRSVAAYHAFRRVHPRGLAPRPVAAFLIYNQEFPRSIAICVRNINNLLTNLKSRYMLRHGSAAMERLDEIRAALGSYNIDRLLERGLHDLLDWLQRQFAGLSTDLGRAYFGHVGAAAPGGPEH